MARKNIFTKCYKNTRWKFWHHRLMMHDNIVVIRVWSYDICIFIVRENLTHFKLVYFAYVSIFSITFNIFLFFFHFKLYSIWSWFLLRRKRLQDDEESTNFHTGIHYFFLIDIFVKHGIWEYLIPTLTPYIIT